MQGQHASYSDRVDARGDLGRSESQAIGGELAIALQVALLDQQGKYRLVGDLDAGGNLGGTSSRRTPSQRVF